MRLTGMDVWRRRTTGRLLVLGLAGNLLLLWSSSAAGWYAYSEQYAKWQESRPLTMAAWHSAVARDRVPERIARYKASGLNQIFFLKLPRACDWGWVQAAREAGLEWMGGMRGGPPKAAVQQAMEIGGGSAVIVFDEPGDRPEDYAAIRERIAWVHDTYPGLLAYANLSITKINIERYITECKPDVFSYDQYPLYRNGETFVEYLYYLNVARETARRHRLPFWMILQAYGREHERPTYAYRVPGEADARFLAFTLLAHGGNGMQFFTYYGFRESMIAIPYESAQEEALMRYEESAPTACYFAMQDMAPEIQQLGRALLRLRTKDEIGYAGAVPRKCSAFQGHGALKAVSILEDQEAPVLVSFFDDRAGEEYFMVVNLTHGKDLTKGEGQRTVRLVFENVESVERLNRLTGAIDLLHTNPSAGNTCTLDIVLPGGTGDLFKWHNGKPWDIRPQP